MSSGHRPFFMPVTRQANVRFRPVADLETERGQASLPFPAVYDGLLLSGGEARIMEEYRVCGRYDLWRGVWSVSQSNVPELQVEAETRQAFEKEVQRFCDDLAGAKDHAVHIETIPKAMWTFASRFIGLEIINGRIVTREEGNNLRARYEKAG